MTPEAKPVDQVEPIVEESPVLRLPEDSGWLNLLREKLTQYETRMTQSEFTSLPPEIVAITDTGYKHAILKELLKGEPIKTFELGLKFYRNEVLYDQRHFQIACAVIERYTVDRQYLTDSLHRFQPQQH